MCAEILDPVIWRAAVEVATFGVGAEEDNGCRPAEHLRRHEGNSARHVIDTHCHILQGLDDGPATVDEAVELAVSMAEQGIRHAVCTPHLSRQFPTERAAAQVALVVLERELASHEIALSLTLAAEVSEPNTVGLGGLVLRERSIGGRFLVVELEQASTGTTVEATVRRLHAVGLVPVIAHPERLAVFQREPDLAGKLRRRGALLQVVAPSLVGRWGENVERTAWSMLTTGVVDLVASDAHGALRRRCHMADAAEAVRRRLGAPAWRTVAEDGPARLLGDAWWS